MKLQYCAVFAVLVLAGCAASTPLVLVPDAEGVESQSVVTLTCGKPWPLTRDCSNISGATKPVKVAGVEFKVAGTDNGEAIMLMGTTAQGTRGYTSNLAYEALKRTFKEAGIGVVRVTPLISTGQLFGYVVQTDAPAYDLLDKYSTK
jgi:hypothetical protein